MSDTRYVNGVVKTAGEILSTGFPKIIYVDEEPVSVSTLAEQNSLVPLLNSTDVVIESQVTPFVTVGVTDYPLVLGVDFTKCVFIVGSKTYISGKKISPPVLSVSVFGNTLSWTNSYRIKTRIWRTPIYPLSNPSSKFTLIAEVDGVEIPGSINTYIDNSIELLNSDIGVSYYLENAYGTSNTVQGVGPVLGYAAAAWSADSYDSATDSLTDLSGNGHHALFGSAAGADTNDPLLLTYTGENYLYVPGSINGAQLPASHIFPGIDGDSTINATTLRWEARVDGWMSYVVSYYANSGNAGPRIGFFGNRTIGYYGLQRNDSTLVESTFSHISTDSVPVDAQWISVESTIQDYSITFQYSLDGATWVQLGDIISNPGFTHINGNNLNAGNRRGGVGYRGYNAQVSDTANGKVYLAREYWDGVLRWEFDASESIEPHTSVTNDNTGVVWSILRTSAGRKAVLVDKPILLFGTDDSLLISHSTDFNFVDGDDFTAIVGIRIFGSVAGWLFSKYSNDTSSGWFITQSASDIRANIREVGGISVVSAIATWGVPHEGLSLYAVAERSGGSLKAITPWNDATVLASGDLSNTNDMTIGKNSALGGGNWSDFEFMGAAIFRRTLTTTEFEKLLLELNIT